MKTLPLILLTSLASPVLGQTMHKCPSSIPGAPPIYQQMPCSQQGGGETVPVKSIPTGAGAGISDNAKAYLKDLDQQRAEQAQEQMMEDQRQETLNVERDKARAAEEQARAQHETARAIWGTRGWRW